MSFIDHDEAHAPRACELIGMPCQKLRRGKRDVVGSVSQSLERLTAFVGRALPGEGDDPYTESVKRFAQMECLVGNERRLASLRARARMAACT